MRMVVTSKWNGLACVAGIALAVACAATTRIDDGSTTSGVELPPSDTAIADGSAGAPGEATTGPTSTEDALPVPSKPEDPGPVTTPGTGGDGAAGADDGGPDPTDAPPPPPPPPPDEDDDPPPSICDGVLDWTSTGGEGVTPGIGYQNLSEDPILRVDDGQLWLCTNVGQCHNQPSGLNGPVGWAKEDDC